MHWNQAVVDHPTRSLENPKLQRHLARIAGLIKKIPLKPHNKFTSIQSLQEEPIKISKIGNIAKNVLKHLHKRVMANPLIGNDELNLFTYHGMIQLGYPAQQFKILFDTGSTRLWIRGPGQCTSKTCRTFNPSYSRTFSNLNATAPKIQYGDGSFVEGNWVSDRVQVADTWINNFKFQLGTNVYDTADEDGIMGLGFSQAKLDPTYWEILVHNKLVTSPVFSIFIDSTETSGAITFGGVDLARYSGPLMWIPAIGSMRGSFYWGLELNSIIVGSTSILLDESERNPIVDTGTSLGIFPSALAKKINNQLGLQRVNIGGDSDDYRGFPCPSGKVPLVTNLPNLIFYFGTVQLTFTPQEYLFIQTDNNDQPVCISGIVPGSSNIFILGNVLIRRYYIVFDQSSRQVGFAVANRAPRVPSQFVAASATNSPIGRSHPASIPIVGFKPPVPVGTPVPIAVPG